MMTLHYVTPVKPFKDLYSGDFGSDAIQSGKTYTFLFTQEGSIPYFCKVHPWMTGEIDIEHCALTSWAIKLLVSLNKTSVKWMKWKLNNLLFWTPKSIFFEGLFGSGIKQIWPNLPPVFCLSYFKEGTKLSAQNLSRELIEIWILT